jgi:NAD(P)H-hydrate epimerase
VSAAEMTEIDRLAIDESGVGQAQMMELAGANLTRLAVHLLGALEGRLVTVLAGPGNNGAGGLVVARHLVNRGVRVQRFGVKTARGTLIEARLTQQELPT